MCGKIFNVRPGKIDVEEEKESAESRDGGLAVGTVSRMVVSARKENVRQTRRRHGRGG